MPPILIGRERAGGVSDCVMPMKEWDLVAYGEGEREGERAREINKEQEAGAVADSLYPPDWEPRCQMLAELAT